MEKNYEIVFRKSAEKQLLKLPKEIGRKILTRIELLSDNPFPDESIKMKGYEKVYRIRIQNYRVIYKVINQELVIEVIKIGHRQNIYK